MTQPGTALLRLALFLSVVALGALTLWVSAGHVQ
jgi:hypothetical protein